MGVVARRGYVCVDEGGEGRPRCRSESERRIWERVEEENERVRVSSV